jgi:hypothetical protein
MFPLSAIKKPKTNFLIRHVTPKNMKFLVQGYNFDQQPATCKLKIRDNRSLKLANLKSKSCFLMLD